MRPIKLHSEPSLNGNGPPLSAVLLSPDLAYLDWSINDTVSPIDLYLYPCKPGVMKAVHCYLNNTSDFRIESRIRKMRCSITAVLAWTTIATAALRRNAEDKQYTLEAANIKAKVSFNMIYGGHPREWQFIKYLLVYHVWCLNHQLVG